MRTSRLTLLTVSLALAGVSSPAQAEPGDTAQTTGTAAATVANPMKIRRLSDLRYGRFASPSTASTIRIDPDGTFVPTGEVAASTGIAQPPSGRGPAQFEIEQSGKRTGQVDLPQTITLFKGADTMTVTNLQFDLTRISQSGRDQVFRLDVGGTLQVGAMQAPGYYRGDFNVTVYYN